MNTSAHRDITVLKPGEGEIQRLSQWLLRTQRISQVGGWALNLKSGEVWVSPEARRIYGVSEDERITLSQVQSFPLRAYRPMLDRALHELVTQDKAYDVEFQITRGTDRATRDIHSLAEYNGAEGTVLGVIEDITDWNQAHSALRQSEERFKLAMEANRDGLWDWNVTTGETYYSPGYAAMLGYSTSEVPAHVTTWKDLIHPEDKEAALKANLDCIENRRDDFEIEFRMQAKNGDWRWIMGRGKGVVRDHTGRALRMVGTHTDITERKRAEEEKEKLRAQLTQAQKMESVGRLAGGVAHDFNNMLQAILGNVALALADLPPDNPLRENLEEIQKSAQRSADLTRQLLAFARKQTIQPRVVDLNQTITGLLKMLRRLIGENIDLAWMPGSGLWPIKVDPSQINQVLANLCINARDAITGTGKVTIESANVTLDALYAKTHPECVPGDYVILTVSDTGQGMDESTRAHLFEPFFTTKEVGRGTGLGLATVFGIVKQNRGLLEVCSQPGLGTTFKLCFPRAEAASWESDPETTSVSLHGTETVLLVEDEEQILNLARRILTQYGYQVLTALGPEAALALAASHAGPLHLLITDVVMPGMNGKELSELITATHPETKCLFMSGYTADVIAHHGVLDGSVLFLQKPFTLRTLAEMVRNALEEASG